MSSPLDGRCSHYAPPLRSPGREEENGLINKGVILVTDRSASCCLLRAHHDDAAHPIRLEKLAQCLFHGTALAARCVTYEHAVAIPHNDSSMKHIKIPPCG